MKAWYGLAAGILILAAAPVSAEVYRHVDAQGNVTFSDEPIEGGEAIEVKPVTTITLPKPQVVQETRKLRAEVQREGAVYDSVSITYPKQDQAFHSGNGDIQFQVTSTPGLQPGHKYELTLDGQPVGQSESGNILVNNVFRGTHEARVHIIDENGVQVKTGPSVTFTVHRPSVLN
ncbi:DUF4124 domain-containing protein [Marinobacter lutaoensis]|jgi:hypothetical protein|uniref:DUF4124 domain-containing protein n=1 Tax=Marinobacter lutaoensis TaxID=135739 RepID=A0A1V2DV72_9GAMM|nr:DUF4124 domain-containing protein [Marinobacter lutaoensis]MBE02442.1 DUF4124 domain-containing protein [Marinobacter sp.]MBI43114.1 DUF4124 domain-containing protein [Oceanospirillales bacterium]NVD36766.1 DUF4124 domain-containing protein [Marinobacter lutaoensis]ONF44645.1 DUF4124 domain-containing protein [Marinobacter lutaoensis]|tara:strand:- start:7916 stop:8440 length:525 start_codon:yes stop_codon:yes gene_type:complete